MVKQTSLRRVSLYGMLISIVSALIIGSSLLAINAFKQLETEDGNASSPTLIINDASASNSQAVKFAASIPTGELTAQDLTDVKSKKILFGHQSVGQNMIDNIPALYSSFGVSPPTILSNLTQINSAPGGFFAEFYVGANGDPFGKIDDFDSTVRQYSSKINTALFKFCFIDIVNGVNAQALFNSYKSTMGQLEGDFPNITFIYTTAALDEYSASNALVREQYNSLVRQEYASSGRLFDLANVESTRPDGSRVVGSSNGNTYYQLYENYSSDGAHLNTTGALKVNTSLFKLLSSVN